MKIFGVVGTTLLLLLLGTGVSVYAQDQHEDAKPQAQEEEKPKQEEAKPAKPESDKNVKQEEEKKDENVRRQEEKTSKQDESKAVQNDHHTQAAENRNGGRIPDDKFRAHFGHEHTFRIGHPTIVEGRPRFQYGGYSFVMVDAWPAGWAYTDMVYVDFIDGVYYLIDPVHPGVQIVINVVL